MIKAFALALIFPGFILGISPIAFLQSVQTATVIDPGTTGAFMAALVGAAASYIVAARRFSGKIETTEAKELWTESRAIRKWSQERIEALNGIVDRLEKRNVELEARVEHLENENTALHRELDGKVDA
jgi:predicted RNase H-like nuclease (RuvC/YqgF family)